MRSAHYGAHVQPQPLLRSAQLNALDWMALAAWIIVWAALAGASAALVGLPPAPILVVGALGASAAALVIDRRRWGAMKSYFSWSDDPAVVEQAATKLVSLGIDVETRHGCEPRGTARPARSACRASPARRASSHGGRTCGCSRPSGRPARQVPSGVPFRMLLEVA